MFVKKLNKPVGKTPFQLISKLSKKTNKKYFHTGTLDVMATGLIIAVDTRLRFLETYFKKFSKTYQFEVICGFSTDTHDLLGLITDISKQSCKNLILPKEYFIQAPPKVSYKNLNTKLKLNNFLKGLPLKELPNKSVKIYSFNLLGMRKISKEELFSKLEKDFKKIEGEFRQNEILKEYRLNKNKLPKQFKIIKYTIKVSSGFYIRAFVRDLSKINKIPLTTYSIKRTKVGFYRLPPPHNAFISSKTFWCTLGLLNKSEWFLMSLQNTTPALSMLFLEKLSKLERTVIG